jgi:hypothetical protein
MQSSLIGKIEKANRYAQETDRITFSQFCVNFRGDNNTYNTSYGEGGWKCTCPFFAKWGLCSHTMATEKVLGSMLPADAITMPSSLVE